MVTRLRHLSVVQFALVLAVLYALIGILIGLFWWLVVSPVMIAGMKSGMGTATPSGFAMMTGLGIFAVIVFPIFYGIIGFIAGLIYAALYNLVAGWTGGIEMRLDPAPVSTV
jgi:hypothetical protein